MYLHITNHSVLGEPGLPWKPNIMIAGKEAVRLRRILWAELAWCVQVSVGHLLAGKLAEHGGDVASILSHLLLDGLLHSRGDAT